ncbi:MAG: hypothetical protein MGG11_08000 [Trichodesmium sp. MAG_R03]|nr:hypothetical protein [Trichodesmium sp. MAG_R03]
MLQKDDLNQICLKIAALIFFRLLYLSFLCFFSIFPSLSFFLLSSLLLLPSVTNIYKIGIIPNSKKVVTVLISKFPPPGKTIVPRFYEIGISSQISGLTQCRHI